MECGEDWEERVRKDGRRVKRGGEEEERKEEKKKQGRSESRV